MEKFDLNWFSFYGGWIGMITVPGMLLIYSSFFGCVFVLPGVAVLQLLFGIWKVRTNHDSGPRHILSSLIVGGMWLALVAFVVLAEIYGVGPHV